MAPSSSQQECRVRSTNRRRAVLPIRSVFLTFVRCWVESKNCFYNKIPAFIVVSGDRRANQNPQLTVLQILFLREHNRIATVLSHINPHWDDETLYQESRRILIAEFQHINYHEWLPIILGTDNMLKYGLLYKTKGFTSDYKENVDPSVINAHAHAAFRYFHSSIQGQFQ